MRRLSYILVSIFCLFAVSLAAEELPLIQLLTESDTTYYTSFATALSKANKEKSATLQLLGDIRFDGKAAAQSVKTNLTLDLNGYTIGDTLTGTSLLSLNNDTLHLHVFSSRPGGRIWCTRPHDGRIYAIQCTKGQLTINNVAIDVTNTSDPLPKASACGVNVGKTAALHMSDCAVHISANTNAYGVNTYNATTIERCVMDVHADSTVAYGIYLNKDTTVLEPQEAHVEHCVLRVTAQKKAYGISNTGTVILYRDSIYVQTAQSDCYALYSSKAYAHGEASQCVFMAEAGTITCYGAHVYGGSFLAEDCIFCGTCHMEGYLDLTSSTTRGVGAATNTTLVLRRCRLSARGTNIPVCKGINGVSGNATAQVVLEGCDIYAEGNETTYGVSAGSRLVMENCKISVQAAGGTAYGINISNYYDETQQQDATARIERTKVTVNALKQAYCIYTRAPLLLNMDTVSVVAVEQTGYGLYANNDSALYQISRSVFTAEVGLTSACGAYVLHGNMIAEGCHFNATAHQDTAQIKINDCSARGIYTSENVSLVMNRCVLRAKGTNKQVSKSAYALSTSATSHIELADCELYAECKELARALYAAGNSTSISTIACRRCRMSAKGDTKTYGVHLTSTGVLDSCRIEALSSGSDAYALYANKGCDTILVNECYLKAQADEKALVVNANTNTEGLLWLYGGYCSDDINVRAYLPDGYCVYRLYDGPEYAAGYRYTLRPISDPGVVVARLYDNKSHAIIQEFTSLADGLRYIQYHLGDFTFVVVASCQLSGATTYYVPDYVRMVIAYKENQTEVIGEQAARSMTVSRKRNEYIRVELLDSVNLVVEGGMLEVSAVQQDEGSAVGTVSGDFGYGRLDLAPTASIDLVLGAKLQAWGYITGSGTITAQAGSTVREFMQLGDWKGGVVSFEMVNNPQKVFPITHFFYQNIECPIVYMPGSKAVGSTFIRISEYAAASDDIRLIDSEDALFVMHGSDEENVFIRKEYDPLTDRVIWTTSGDVSLTELIIKANMAIGGGYNLLSSQYVLPLGSNTTIHALSGTLSAMHDVAMLPGCIIEIDEEAQMHIPANTNLYLYDDEEWGSYSDKRYSTVSYSPSWSTCPRDTILSSARIIVNGTAHIEGAMYTTKSGADIIGSDIAEGHIVFVNGAAGNGMVYQLTGTYESHQFTSQTASNAALRNADGSLTHTSQAVAGEIFTYSNGRWAGETGQDTASMGTILQEVPSPRRLILLGNTFYVQARDGALYTLLGIPVKKEDL